MSLAFKSEIKGAPLSGVSYTQGMRYLLLFLVLKAIVLGLIISFSGIGLSPDEAQYWTWSQTLDWGYYSKPPGIAWQIWLTTSLAGNTPFGVRLGALIIGALIPLIIYKAARFADLERRTAFWAAMVAAFSPLGIYLSFAATTDGGAILGLVAAVAITLKGVQNPKGPNYYFVGLAILFGALFKWTALAFWPILFLYFPFMKDLGKKSVITGLLISLCGLIPSIYWNASHEWATFRHVGTTVGGVKSGNFFSFLGAQIGLFSPIYFALLILALVLLLKERKKALIFAAGFPAAILIYVVGAFFKKMQANWAAYLFLPGSLLIAWAACERLKKGKMWLSLGTILSAVAIGALFTLPWLQQTLPLPYKYNPFRQTLGWGSLASALAEGGYDAKNDFLFSDKYQNTSLLSFYGPKQKKAYFFNVSHTRKNQFSYWPGMDREKGKNGYFVVLENALPSSLKWYEENYVEKLSPYFQTVHFAGAYPIFSVAGSPVKYAILFSCHDYIGELPADIVKY